MLKLRQGRRRWLSPIRNSPVRARRGASRAFTGARGCHQQRPVGSSRDDQGLLGWQPDAWRGAGAGRGPVARSTRERARSVDEHEGPPTEPGFPGSFLVMRALVGLRKQLLQF